MFPSTGAIVVAGYTDGTYGSATDMAVARFTAAGALDTSFDTDGKQTVDISSGYETANTVVIHRDGKIVLGGFHGAVGGSSDFTVVRLGTNGALDTSFNTTGYATVEYGGVGSTEHDGVVTLALGESKGSGVFDRRAESVKG